MRLPQGSRIAELPQGNTGYSNGSVACVVLNDLEEAAS